MSRKANTVHSREEGIGYKYAAEEQKLALDKGSDILEISAL